MSEPRSPDAPRVGAPPRARRVSAGYRILGIDPGTRLVGFAVLELGPRLEPRVLRHGVVRAAAGAPVARRLQQIFDGLREVLGELRPQAAVIEDVFYGKNFQSALRIGEGRGVALLAAAAAGCEVVEYSPAAVKQAVCGNGRASKSQVQGMVARLLAIGGPLAGADAADALAIAFCHAQRVRGGLLGAFPRPRRRRRSTQRALQALLERLNQGRS